MNYTIIKRFSLILMSFVFALASCIFYLASNKVFAQTGTEILSGRNDSNYDGGQSAIITLTIQVPSEYLQTKSILETASIYGVDANMLIQKINETYSNDFKLQQLDKLSDLQAHGIQIDEIKKIALSLQDAYPAPLEQKEILAKVIKEEKIINNRQSLFWTIVVILCLYFISYLFTYRELMHHNIHKKTWNALLSVSIIVYAVIILSYLIPQIYSINMSIGLDILYQNLRIGFIIIFLGFSHALRYIFHYRPLKKKLHHKISNNQHIHHKETHHNTKHKTSHPHHTPTKAKKI